MSYIEKQSLETPYNIGLYRYASGSTLTGRAQTLLGISQSMGRYGIGWYSSNALFQVQYRYRRRQKPSVAIITDPSGGDVWVPWNGDLLTGSPAASGEWGEWQGVDVEQDESKSPTTPAAYAGVPGVYALDSASGAYSPYIVPLPYDLTTYDLTEMEIRVRVILTFTSPKQVSAWGYGRVTLANAPIINGITAQRNAGGGLTIEVDTNLTRGGTLLTADGFTTGGRLVTGTEIYTQSGADPSVTVEKWPEGETVSIQRLAITTADGYRVNLGNVEITVTDPEPQEPITAPTIDIDEAGNVTVTPPSAGYYDSIAARATYTDEEGRVYDEVIPLTDEGGEWAGLIPTPPLDVEITVLVSYTRGDEWDYKAEAVTVPSDGRVLFDFGADHYALRYNMDRQTTTTLEGDTVPIQGSELPKSRHGFGRSSSMTIQGTMINPAEDAYNGDGWLPQLEIFNAPHDWILRTPNGLRRRVRVESYTPDWVTQSANRLMGVTIVTQEVAE